MSSGGGAEDIEIVVNKRKALDESQALKLLSTFLDKDQKKKPEDQIPSDVLHQLQTVRDNLQGGASHHGGFDEEEEEEDESSKDHHQQPPPAQQQQQQERIEASHSGSKEKEKKDKKKKKHKKDK